MLGGATPHLVLGADAIVASVEEKRRLRQRTGAAAVDLESGAVARVAAMHSMPFAVLRAICDPAESALPPAALVRARHARRHRAWRVLGSIAAHPTTTACAARARRRRCRCEAIARRTRQAASAGSRRRRSLHRRRLDDPFGREIGPNRRALTGRALDRQCRAVQRQQFPTDRQARGRCRRISG